MWLNLSNESNIFLDIFAYIFMTYIQWQIKNERKKKHPKKREEKKI